MLTWRFVRMHLLGIYSDFHEFLLLFFLLVE
jgi:hypothetical protein